VILCFSRGCLRTIRFSKPTTIYGDTKFRNVTESSFLLKITKGYPETAYNHCHNLENELDELLRSNGFDDSAFEPWSVDDHRRDELNRKDSYIDYSDPIEVTKVFLNALLSEEYDFIPYLIAPEYLLYFSPRNMKNMRSSIQLPENPKFILKAGKGSNKSVVGVEGTKYGFELQKIGEKWLFEY